MISFDIPLRRGVFRFRLIPALMTLVVAGAFVTLGTWQIARLQEKRELIAAIEARMKQMPIRLSEIVTNVDQWNYRPVSVTGILLYDKEMPVEVPDRQGRTGYHILTPLQRRDQGAVLVDLGWVPRAYLNPVMRRAYWVNGQVTLTGIARVKDLCGQSQAFDTATGIWRAVDTCQMSQKAQLNLQKGLVVEASARSLPGDYPVGGQTTHGIPNKHFTYALAWYSLALTILVMYFRFYWKRESAEEDVIST